MQVTWEEFFAVDACTVTTTTTAEAAVGRAESRRIPITPNRKFEACDCESGAPECPQQVSVSFNVGIPGRGERNGMRINGPLGS